ncbi:hypothetical protein BH11ACT3_BH11ACT3_05810 [soil metagenome]
MAALDDGKVEAFEAKEWLDLVDHFSMVDLYFLRQDGHRADHTDEPELVSQPRIDNEIFTRRNERALSVRIRSKVRAHDAEYAVDIIVDFASDADVHADQELVTEFVKRVAMMAAWPYIRGAVSDIGGRLRAEPLTLGILKPSDIEIGEPIPADPVTGEPLGVEGD